MRSVIQVLPSYAGFRPLVCIEITTIRLNQKNFDDTHYIHVLRDNHPAVFPFVSEEEQGYVPLTWLWTVNGLAPGRHLLTVNVSSFSGKVSVASTLLIVAE